MSDELAYCTFNLDGLFFGVEVLRVQEVIRYQRMTRCRWHRASCAG